MHNVPHRLSPAAAQKSAHRRDVRPTLEHALRDDPLFLPVIFSGMNAQWEKMLHLGVPASFPAKSFIAGFGDSERSSGLYFIKRGRVCLSNLDASGRERVMLYMGQQMLFNEIPMFLPTSTYSFTCMEATETIFIPRTILTTDFIQAYPDLMLNLMESMSKKSQSFYSRLSSLRVHGSFANTCGALYSMHLYNRKKDAVAPVLSKQELAAYLGIHRSSLHKALSRLQAENIISQYKRGSLSIYEPERLYDYALHSDD